MKILVSNDDGFEAPGLRTLCEVLATEHELCVIAPDRERSGVAHAMTFTQAGIIKKIGEASYSCSGTPADCVAFVHLGVIDFKPDVVIGGINRGPNIGTDIIYSGTCSVARQAALVGRPGLAVSCASFAPTLHYHGGAEFVLHNLTRLISYCSTDVFININVPSTEKGQLRGYWARPSIRSYNDSARGYDLPDGARYAFYIGGIVSDVEDEFSDASIVARGDVALSPVLVRPQTASFLQVGSKF